MVFQLYHFPKNCAFYQDLYLAGQSDLISQVTIALDAIPHMAWVWSFMKEAGKMRPTGALLLWILFRLPDGFLRQRGKRARVRQWWRTGDATAHGEKFIQTASGDSDHTTEF